VSVYVVRPRGTTMEHLTQSSTHQVGAGELFIASTEDGAPYSVQWVNGIIEATALPFDLIRQVASVDGPIRFSDLRPYNRRTARHLAATIDYVIEGLRDRPDSMNEPLVASTVGQLLCATVLSAFPNTALVEPTIEDRHDSHPRTLRRAIAYIESHAHEEITVADIAAAAHVTVRALQHAFRRHRDTTPMGYVRLVRLRQAHLDLLATDPANGVTVTQVAARWGFFHPGRFARYYREIHGCSPYQTLLRDAP
jgi:AraC-like DNA-binding protein